MDAMEIGLRMHARLPEGSCLASCRMHYDQLSPRDQQRWIRDHPCLAVSVAMQATSEPAFPILAEVIGDEQLCQLAAGVIDKAFAVEHLQSDSAVETAMHIFQLAMANGAEQALRSSFMFLLKSIRQPWDPLAHHSTFCSLIAAEAWKSTGIEAVFIHVVLFKVLVFSLILVSDRDIPDAGLLSLITNSNPASVEYEEKWPEFPNPIQGMMAFELLSLLAKETGACWARIFKPESPVQYWQALCGRKQWRPTAICFDLLLPDISTLDSALALPAAECKACARRLISTTYQDPAELVLLAMYAQQVMSSKGDPSRSFRQSRLRADNGSMMERKQENASWLMFYVLDYGLDLGRQQAFAGLRILRAWMLLLPCIVQAAAEEEVFGICGQALVSASERLASVKITEKANTEDHMLLILVFCMSLALCAAQNTYRGALEKAAIVIAPCIQAAFAATSASSTDAQGPLAYYEGFMALHYRNCIRNDPRYWASHGGLFRAELAVRIAKQECASSLRTNRHCSGPVLHCLQSIARAFGEERPLFVGAVKPGNYRQFAWDVRGLLLTAAIHVPASLGYLFGGSSAALDGSHLIFMELLDAIEIIMLQWQASALLQKIKELLDCCQEWLPVLQQSLRLEMATDTHSRIGILQRHLSASLDDQAWQSMHNSCRSLQSDEPRTVAPTTSCSAKQGQFQLPDLHARAGYMHILAACVGIHCRDDFTKMHIPDSILKTTHEVLYHCGWALTIPLLAPLAGSSSLNAVLIPAIVEALECTGTRGIHSAAPATDTDVFVKSTVTPVQLHSDVLAALCLLFSRLYFRGSDAVASEVTARLRQAPGLPRDALDAVMGLEHLFASSTGRRDLDVFDSLTQVLALCLDYGSKSSWYICVVQAYRMAARHKLAQAGVDESMPVVPSRQHDGKELPLAAMENNEVMCRGSHGFSELDCSPMLKPQLLPRQAASAVWVADLILLLLGLHHEHQVNVDVCWPAVFPVLMAHISLSVGDQATVLHLIREQIRRLGPFASLNSAPEMTSLHKHPILVHKLILTSAFTSSGAYSSKLRQLHSGPRDTILQQDQQKNVGMLLLFIEPGRECVYDSDQHSILSFQEVLETLLPFLRQVDHGWLESWGGDQQSSGSSVLVSVERCSIWLATSGAGEISHTTMGGPGAADTRSFANLDETQEFFQAFKTEMMQGTCCLKTSHLSRLRAACLYVHQCGQGSSLQGLLAEVCGWMIRQIGLCVKDLDSSHELLATCDKTIALSESVQRMGIFSHALHTMCAYFPEIVLLNDNALHTIYLACSSMVQQRSLAAPLHQHIRLHPAESSEGSQICLLDALLCLSSWDPFLVDACLQKVLRLLGQDLLNGN